MRLLFALVRWSFFKVLALGFFILRMIFAPFRRNRQLWLEVELSGALPDLPQRTTLFSFFQSEQSLSLFELLQTFEGIEKEKRIEGLVVKSRNLHADWSTLWELRQGLLKVKASGKRIVFYADGLRLPSLWLASAADEIHISPQGHVELAGFRSEIMFFKAALDKLGVKADFLRVGRYKSYPEIFIQEGMSEAMREATRALISDLRQVVLKETAEGLSVEPAEVEAWVAQGAHLAEGAKAAGLVDAVQYEDQIWTAIEAAAKEAGKNAFLVPIQGFMTHLNRQSAFKKPLLGRQQVAVVEMAGAIIEGEESPRTRGGGSHISRKAYTTLFQLLEEDPEVSGVVLRVNSPGGSALVSDILWREICRLREAKPVYVSMGASAASGGYYISAPAAKIYASPLTMTGSIGVVMGKFAGGNLASRLGITVDTLEFDPRAAMHSPIHLFTSEERAHLQTQLDEMYAAFVSKVKEGRELDDEAAEAAAQGRVWSGLAAEKLGLVDELGGMQSAWMALLKELDIHPNKIEVVPVSSPGGPGLLSMVGMASAQHSPDLNGLLQRLLPAALAAYLPLFAPGTRPLALALHLPQIRAD